MNIEIQNGQALVSKEDLETLLKDGLVAVQMRVSHILVPTLQKAQEIAKELASSSDLKNDFAHMAKAHSSCPSKAQGGDLGYFSQGQMVPEFEKAALEMGVGTLSSEVTTQFGTHLLYKEDERYLLALSMK